VPTLCTKRIQSAVYISKFILILLLLTQLSVPAARPTLAAESISATDISDETIAAMKNYRSEMLPKVLRHWSRPNDDLTCVISFDLDGLGSVSHAAVAQSSGQAQVDNAALDAVKKSSPFRALPGDLDRLSGRITFSSTPSISTETPESSRLFRQAAASIESADFPAAIAKLRRAIDIAGGDCPKYHQLLSQSFVSYALFLPNDSPAVPAQLYESLLANSNNDGARQQLDEVLAKKGINPKDAKIRLALAKKALHERNMDMAEVELQEAKRLIGDDDATAADINEIEQLVSLYIDCDYWQKFLQKHPDSFDGHLGLGLAWQRGNKLDSATAEYKKALAIKPDSSFAKSLLQAISDHLPPE
jgi:TonB family protein